MEVMGRLKMSGALECARTHLSYTDIWQSIVVVVLPLSCVADTVASNFNRPPRRWDLHWLPQQVERASSAACPCAGGAKPLREKALPGLLDVFGWCTWDAFYSRVSARGARPPPSGAAVTGPFH
jgi:hypothetical protein